jgi:hypothetical protein
MQNCFFGKIGNLEFQTPAMKKLLVTLIIICVAQFLRAQTPQLVLSDSSKPNMQNQLLFPDRIIAKTKNGTIYALPQDNMPVFVPDSSFTSNMPVTNRKLPYHSTMPNSYSPRYQYRNNPTPKVDSLLKTKPLRIEPYKQKPTIKQ